MMNTKQHYHNVYIYENPILIYVTPVFIHVVVCHIYINYILTIKNTGENIWQDLKKNV